MFKRFLKDCFVASLLAMTPTLAYAIPDGAGNDIFTGNVGIGTTTPQAPLSVLSGNMGIGTWTAAGGALMVQGGNVGIGTLNANQALTVAGKIYSTSGGIQFPDNTVQTTAGSGSTVVTSGINNQVAKYAATGMAVGGSSLLFDDGTNVGIGTAVPSGKFQVNNNALAFYVDTNSNVGIGTTKTSAGALSIMNGNVGIGTWVPGDSLDVVKGNIGIGTADGLVGIGTTSTILTVRNNTSSVYAGWQAGAGVTTGNLNVALGYQALNGVTSGVELTAIGYLACKAAVGGSIATFVGWEAGGGANCASANAAFGLSALNNASAGDILAFGAGALSLASVSGTYNTAFGYNSLANLTSGTFNTALGYQAGYPNGANGDITGQTNVWIGANSGPSGTSDVSHSVGIGSYATAGASNVMVLGGMGGNALNVGIGTDMNGASGSLIVESNNNVGIGTVTPQAALVVTNGNMGIGTWTAANGNLIVNGGGNVGIGSVSPQAQLDLGTSTTPLTMPGLKASSGTRFLCISTTGIITSSASACSGT